LLGRPLIEETPGRVHVPFRPTKALPGTAEK